MGCILSTFDGELYGFLPFHSSVDVPSITWSDRRQVLDLTLQDAEVALRRMHSYAYSQVVLNVCPCCINRGTLRYICDRLYRVLTNTGQLVIIAHGMYAPKIAGVKLTVQYVDSNRHVTVYHLKQ